MYRVNGSYLESMPPQGWQCPICKRVYSPTTFMCCYCGQNETTISTTTTATSGYVDVETDREKEESRLSDRIREICRNFNKEMEKHL